MRILFLNKASLRHEGGAEIRTREVGKRLVLAGHEVVVLAAKTGLHEPPCEQVDGMKLYHKKVLPDWLLRRFQAPHYLSLAAANLFLMFHLYFFLKKEKFDLIREDLSPFPPSFLLALTRLSSSKRIAVAHNLPGTLQGWLKFYGPLYGFAGFLFDRLLRKGRLKYDRIICAGKSLAGALKNSPKIAGKTGYVPNGIDPGRFSKMPTRRKDSPAIRLLSVGRLAEIKGHRHLIEAISLLKNDARQINLVILGKGDLRESLIRLAGRLKVEDRIEIRPPVPYEKMPPVYHESDFLVLPSVSEGFPMVILEAMACGLPIVATNISGITDILDTRSATLCAREDPRDLADKLRWAFEHPDEIARKREVAYTIAKRYDWNTIAEQEMEGDVSPLKEEARGNCRMTVVIPTKDRPVELRECVASIARQTLLPREVLVIDDGCLSPSVITELRNLLPPASDLRYLRKTPPDLAASRNLGAREASCDIVLFLDDDGVIEKDAIEQLWFQWQNLHDPAIIGVGGIIKNHRRKGRLERIFEKLFFLSSPVPWDITDWGFQVWDPFPKEPVRGFYGYGGFSSYRREVLLQVPFRSLSPGRTSLDDVDWCLRAKKQGYAVMITPAARFFHKGSPVSRDAEFTIGVKEGYNRSIIFDTACPRNLSTRFKFWVASAGWILRLLPVFRWSRALGLIKGHLRYLREKKAT